jgi:hypothetical protein
MAVEKEIIQKPCWLTPGPRGNYFMGVSTMKKFIIGAVAAVALLVCTAVESNAQFPVARGVRAAARGAVRVAAPGIGPIYGPVYAPRVYARPVYPVYRAPIVVAPRVGYYGGGYYGGYYGGGYGWRSYGWGPGVGVGVGPVGVRVGF